MALWQKRRIPGHRAMGPGLAMAIAIGLVTFSDTVGASSTEAQFRERAFTDPATLYEIQTLDECILEIEATGRQSASGLYLDEAREIAAFLPDYPRVEWSWRVDEIHETADIAVKGKDDFAASLLFIFGRPGLFSRPKVLSYAWVGQDADIEAVIRSPRASNHVRTVVLDNSASPVGEFRMHARDLREDYKRAFGDYPREPLSGFGVFTDNDQTGEPVRAVYRFQLE